MVRRARLARSTCCSLPSTRSARKEMLVQQLELNSSKLLASMNKIQATRWEVATEFANKLDEATERLPPPLQGGTRDTWRTQNLRDSESLKGTTNINLSCLSSRSNASCRRKGQGTAEGTAQPPAN